MLNLCEKNILLAHTDNIVVIEKPRENIQGTNHKLINIGNDNDLTIKSGNTNYIMEKKEGLIITSTREIRNKTNLIKIRRKKFWWPRTTKTHKAKKIKNK